MRLLEYHVYILSQCSAHIVGQEKIGRLIGYHTPR